MMLKAKRALKGQKAKRSISEKAHDHFSKAKILEYDLNTATLAILLNRCNLLPPSSELEFCIFIVRTNHHPTRLGETCFTAVFSDHQGG